MKWLLIAGLASVLACSSVRAEDLATDESALPLLQQSGLFMREGKKEEALAGFEKCLQYKLSAKHESYVRMCIGSLSLATDKEKGFENLKKARGLDPENTSLLPVLGSAYAQRHELTEARECLNAYLTAKPDGENVEGVKKLLKQLDEIDAETALLKKINGAVDLYNQKKYAEAVALLEETQKGEHGHKKTEQEILAMCYAGQGKNQQAIEMFKEILAVDPKQPKIVSALASAYEGMGDLKQARETLKKYLHMEHKGEMAQSAKDRMPVLKKVMKTAGNADGADYFKAVSNKYLTRWSMTRMPLRIYIEPGTGVANYIPDFDKCVPNALDMWCKAMDGKISWTRVEDKANADIEVMYTANPAEVGMSKSHSEAGTCETRVLRQEFAKIGAVTHAKIKLLTTDNDGKAYTMDVLSATAVHEVGHALGMKEHSSNPNDMMFFSTTRNVREGLTDRDIATIKAVYTAVVYEDGRIVVAGREEEK
jgi:tetratricopeptide (TPR) repeat protein